MIWPLAPIIEGISCCLVLVEIPFNLLRVIFERDHEVKQERKFSPYNAPEHHYIRQNKETIEKRYRDTRSTM